MQDEASSSLTEIFHKSYTPPLTDCPEDPFGEERCYESKDTDLLRDRVDGTDLD